MPYTWSVLGQVFWHACRGVSVRAGQDYVLVKLGFLIRYVHVSPCSTRTQGASFRVVLAY
jgi:hypothetical protein